MTRAAPVKPAVTARLGHECAVVVDRHNRGKGRSRKQKFSLFGYVPVVECLIDPGLVIRRHGANSTARGRACGLLCGTERKRRDQHEACHKKVSARLGSHPASESKMSPRAVVHRCLSGATPMLYSSIPRCVFVGTSGVESQKLKVECPEKVRSRS